MLQALARVLRPLVRAAIAAGVTFPVLADLLRGLYIDVASHDLATDQRARSDSRISLLTGIHRKELRRQRAEPHGAREPAIVTLTSRLIGRWLGDPAYHDPAGTPLALPRTGPAPSFEALVTAVTTDVHPRSILDDWVAGGLATLDAAGAVTLAARAFLPAEASAAKLHYFARNLHDHAAAAVANIGAAAPPFLDRSVHYDGLSPAAADALELAARAAAERTLLDVNRLALRLSDEDAPGAARRRVNLGLYVYAEDEPDAP